MRQDIDRIVEVTGMTRYAAKKAAEAQDRDANRHNIEVELDEEVEECDSLEDIKEFMKKYITPAIAVYFHDIGKGPWDVC